MIEKLLLLLIPRMLDTITPQLRDGIHEWLMDLEKKAEATPNPWDNLFVGFLRMVLNGRSG